MVLFTADYWYIADDAHIIYQVARELKLRGASSTRLLVVGDVYSTVEESEIHLYQSPGHEKAPSDIYIL